MQSSFGYEDRGIPVQASKRKTPRIALAANEKTAIHLEMPRHSNPTSHADINVAKAGEMDLEQQTPRHSS